MCKVSIGFGKKPPPQEGRITIFIGRSQLLRFTIAGLILLIIIKLVRALS